MDIVALIVETQFTAESLYILDYKVAEHRDLLTSTFADFTLRPKYQYIENYPEQIRIHVPLADVWTMLVERKHKFFKKLVRDAQNFQERCHDTCSETPDGS